LPQYKISEIELLLKISTDQEILQFITDHGINDIQLKQYKKLLKERK